MAKETKDHKDKDVKAALQQGKELPSNTRLQFYGQRSVDAGTGEVVATGQATGDDGNTPSPGAGGAGGGTRRRQE